ncbi:MAG: GntR family transcriptional regulator [Acidimicrobiales bacterium]
MTGSLADAVPERLGREYRSKADLVAETLRELIADGTIAAGARLRQRELASLFQLSPTPVREGLQKLESEGLVHFDVHRGATVTALPVERLEEHLQILIVLETLAGELAASRMTPDRIAELLAIAEEHASCTDGDPRIRELNRDFHFCIYEASESPMLVTLLRFLWRSFPMGPQFWRPHEEARREHALIVAALSEGNVARTASLLNEHVVGSMASMRRDRSLDGGDSPLTVAVLGSEKR